MMQYTTVPTSSSCISKADLWSCSSISRELKDSCAADYIQIYNLLSKDKHSSWSNSNISFSAGRMRKATTLSLKSNNASTDVLSPCPYSVPLTLSRVFDIYKGSTSLTVEEQKMMERCLFAQMQKTALKVEF